VIPEFYVEDGKGKTANRLGVVRVLVIVWQFSSTILGAWKIK